MCCGILKGFGGLGAIVALILVVVALLKQLILLVGFLLIWIALLIYSGHGIWQARARKLAAA